MSVAVRDADHTSPAARELIRALYDELTPLYGGAITGDFDPIDFAAPGCAFVIAWDESGAAIGCGALRRLDEETGEIKRMYVRSSARGRGVGRAVLAALEERAAAWGYARVWLETGLPQPDAVRLYEKSGYSRIPCFGPHAGDPESVCFEKALRR